MVSSSLTSCQDGQYASAPTCGYQYDSYSRKIPGSQGFCCRCGVLDTLGLDNDSLSRGKICQAFNFGSNSATAHCLAYDGQQYSGYRIGTPSLYYQIKVTVGQESLLLGSQVSLATDKAQTVRAQLVGSLALDTPAPALSQQVLLRPSNNQRQFAQHVQ